MDGRQGWPSLRDGPGKANRKGEFRVVTRSGTAYAAFPYLKAEPRPDASNKVVEVVVDRELASEAFTYKLASGAEGSVHLEQVLEYNRDPRTLRDALLYKLSLEAERRVAQIGQSRRELARRLGTSLSQLYRLLDPTNTKKSIDPLVALLQVLDCSVDLVVGGGAPSEQRAPWSHHRPAREPARR